MRRCSRNGETAAIMALAPVTDGWALAQAKAGVGGGLFAITGRIATGVGADCTAPKVEESGKDLAALRVVRDQFRTILLDQSPADPCPFVARQRPE
jgi:hypothetical protein